jgi:hypothetical protein
MKNGRWRKWALSLAGCAVLFQAGGCAGIAPVVTAWATAISAGGVLYLVARVIE